MTTVAIQRRISMKPNNSPRVAAKEVDMLFLATPPASRYSKREEPLDTSALTIEGKTYAESKSRLRR
jgi:hypothetical protein